MSLEIEKSIGDPIVVKLNGRLDTASAPEFENVMNELILLVKPIIIDLKELDYVSSAGLRVFLMAQKKVNANTSSMKIINVNEIILDIFKMTGFTEILTIE